MRNEMRTIDKIGTILVIAWGFVFTILAILLFWFIM